MATTVAFGSVFPILSNILGKDESRGPEIIPSGKSFARIDENPGMDSRV